MKHELYDSLDFNQALVVRYFELCQPQDTELVLRLKLFSLRTSSPNVLLHAKQQVLGLKVCAILLLSGGGPTPYKRVGLRGAG